MFTKQFTWISLVKIIVFLIIIWLFLYAFRAVLQRTNLFGRYQSSLLRITEVLFLMFEPLTILLVVTTTVLVNPPLHGLILLLIVGGAFTHIKNYFSGRIVRFDKRFKVGKKLKINEISGVLFEKERLGLRLKTGKGLQFVNYSHLLHQGYMLEADEEIGGFYRLQIKPDKGVNQQTNHSSFLQNLFITAPYLDYNYKPEFSEQKNSIHVQISVREKTHLEELCTLIREQGYICKILKN